MPKLDGIKAAAMIRQNPRTKNIPILAATALARPGDMDDCLRAGCDGYISKPFTHRELGAALTRLLDKRSAST